MPPKTAQKQQHPVLILTQSGDVVPAKIAAPAGGLTLAAIQTHLKKKRGGIECIATYKAKPLFLSLFGATEGDDENQNQHQLPPPYDTAAFYGDIILVASKTDKSFDAPVALKPEEYEEFYTKMFDGGYDSDGGEEDIPAEEDEVAAVEDDDDVEEGKEFDEEEEAEEEEAEEDAEEEGAGAGEADADVDDDQAVAAPKKKAAAAAAAAAAKKKKAAAAKANNTLTGTGTAYPDAPILSEEEQLQEEISVLTAAEPTAPQRQQVIRALNLLFSDHFNEPTILALERAIFNGAIRQAKLRHVVRSWDYPLFAHLYKMHALHISSNFHPESYVQNHDLFDQFQKGDLALDNIATMNTYELYPSRWRELFEQRQIREKKQLEGNRDRATDQFTCTRCWKRECTYYEMQTRSADEPMTIFITCLNCGKKWRQ